MINKEQKEKIAKAIKDNLKNYDSQTKMAVVLGIDKAVLSRILKGETEQVLSDGNWFSIARKLEVQFREQIEWKTVETDVFKFINFQLIFCKENSTSAVLCDIADIGKSYTAKHFQKANKNVVYIDCSQYKSKQKLVQKIAQEFGLASSSRYSDVYDDLIFYIQSTEKPLVILDEAGDLEYSAFLELKALWNATEYNCGWYMLGADGLREIIEKNIGRKKVGYTEIFSRFGQRFQKISPAGGPDLEDFKNTQIAQIAKANKSDINVKQVVAAVNGSLRRVRVEIQKIVIQKS
ncbi:MAG: AAA family ATPase [Bacteroidales bacterium]|jgi:DNA transposition AAA+ family ATPase|nr:AAA family ATPase [Bacteroidales bacterium]